VVELLGRPFSTEFFYFGDDKYFEMLYTFGQKVSMMKELGESKKARGIRDAVYINRTYLVFTRFYGDLKPG
jgi:hypothetical protein